MAASGLASSPLWLKMAEQVNQQLTEGERFGRLAWVPKSLRLPREYSRLYPNENLLRKQSVLFALAFGRLFLSAWCLGFFRQ